MLRNNFHRWDPSRFIMFQHGETVNDPFLVVDWVAAKAPKQNLVLIDAAVMGYENLGGGILNDVPIHYQFRLRNSSDWVFQTDGTMTELYRLGKNGGNWTGWLPLPASIEGYTMDLFARSFADPTNAFTYQVSFTLYDNSPE